MIDNNLLHEYSLFLRGCFTVQRNLFSYLWNLKTLIFVANLRKDQQVLAIWKPQNVCLPERKKSAELWGSVSIYRGQRTLKNRHGRLGCESGRILLWKDRKRCALSSLERPKPKTWKFGPFRVPFGTPKMPNWPLDTKHSFVFECHLDSFFRVFWPVLVPRRVFILRLWFLSLFWIIQAI